MSKPTRTEMVQSMAEAYKFGGWDGVLGEVETVTDTEFPAVGEYTYTVTVKAETMERANEIMVQGLAEATISGAEDITYLPDLQTSEDGPVDGPAFLIDSTAARTLTRVRKGLVVVTRQGSRYISLGGGMFRAEGKKGNSGFSWENFVSTAFPIRVTGYGLEEEI